MDEDKVIRPMDFVRLTNIDESNVIKDTKNHIGLVKEVSRDGRMSIIWIGETYSQLAWFKSSELEVERILDKSSMAIPRPMALASITICLEMVWLIIVAVVLSFPLSRFKSLAQPRLHS